MFTLSDKNTSPVAIKFRGKFCLLIYLLPGYQGTMQLERFSNFAICKMHSFQRGGMEWVWVPFEFLVRHCGLIKVNKAEQMENYHFYTITLTRTSQTHYGN